MNSLKELLQTRTVTIAQLPPKNRTTLDEVDKLAAYTVPLISHDYAAKTPAMWNTLYEKLGLNLRNIMIIADPKNAATVLHALKNDPKYLGGGAGVGFKEAVIPHLDELRPADLKSVNIIVKDHGKLIGYNTDAQGLVQSLEEQLHRVGKTLEGSVLVILGAGGVAREAVRHLAHKKPRRIAIINRTHSKAVAIASEFTDIAYGAPETLIRGVLLNSWDKPDAIINLTDKGSDGTLEPYSAFAHVTEHPGDHETQARTTLRELAKYTPDVVFMDIVLPKSGLSTSLRWAEAAGLEHRVDGKPMVTYQAVPAFLYVAKAHPHFHPNPPPDDEILAVFKKAATTSST